MEVRELFVTFVTQNVGLVVLDCLCAVASPTIELLLIPSLFGAILQSASSGSRAAADRQAAMLAAAAAMFQVTHALRNWVATEMVAAFDSFVKVRALDNLLRQLPGCNSPTSGDIVFMLTTASEISRVWLEWLNEHVLPYGAMTVCGFIAFLRVDTHVCAAVTALVIAMLLTMQWVIPRCQPGAADHATSMSALHNKIEDLVNNALAVQTGNTHDAEVQRLQTDVLPTAYEGYHKAFGCARWFQMAFVPLFAVFFIFALRRLVGRLRDGTITQAQFVSTFFVMMGLLNSVVWTSDTVGDYIVDTGHMGKMSTTLFHDTRTDAVTPFVPPTRPPVAAVSVVGLQQVTFAYGKDDVLRNISLQFETGQCTSLVGSIGAGKSTVLKLLLGFCAPQHGAMYLDGQWYGELGLRAVREQVFIVPQVAMLFDAPLLYNVRYGNESRYTEAEVRRYVVQNAGEILGDRVDATSVGPGGQHLSGGQRQVVWCLRAFLRLPRVILLDEPTASMDAPSKRLLLRLLDEARRAGTTIVVVSHDPVLLDACTRSLSLPT
jgi:ABC-type multidrug transport system fused ATPase/permease subunit